MSNNLEIIRAEDLFFNPTPPDGRDSIVEDMIPQGLTLLSGDPKSCKSWMMLDLCFAVTSGDFFLGKPTKQCSVAYFALEDSPKRLQDRMFLLKKEPAQGLYFVTRCRGLNEGLLKDFDEILETDHDVRLIIIDTLQRIRGIDAAPANASQYSKDDDVLSKLKAYADDHNIAILVVHHNRKLKDKENPLNEVLGSTAMSGVPDMILKLNKDRTRIDGELLSVGRDSPQWKMILRFENYQWHVMDTISEEQLAKESIPEILYTIATFIKGMGVWEGTMTQLMEAVGEKNMSSSALSSYINKYYYTVFFPEGIRKTYRKTASERIHKFECIKEIDE